MCVFSHLYMCRGLKKPFWHSDPVQSDTRVPRVWKLLELCHWIQIRMAHSEQNSLYLFFFLQCYRSKMANAISLRSHLHCYQALGYGAQQSRLCCAHLADLVLLCLYPGTLRWTPPGILEGDNAAVSTTSIYWAHYQPPAPSGTDCVPFSCVLGSFSYQHMSNNRSTGARWTHSPVLPQSWLCRSYLCSEVHFCFYSSPRGFES